MTRKEPREICAALDRFRVPAAVVETRRDRFIAWNNHFEQKGVLSKAELTLGRPSKLIVLSSGEAAEAGDQPFHFTWVVPAAQATVAGRCYPAGQDHTLWVLDTFAVDRTADDYLCGLLVGQHATHDRLKQSFHDTVSQQVMAATFAVETLRDKLERDGAPGGSQVAAISGLIQTLITDIKDALDFQAVTPPPTMANLEPRQGNV
ncbi:MAG TPA: hypothetical protein VGD78_08945 [Chthoniobacterales bacterium]